jgi:hypothetical protein
VGAEPAARILRNRCNPLCASYLPVLRYYDQPAGARRR